MEILVALENVERVATDRLKIRIARKSKNKVKTMTDDSKV